jgi:hypothetical protein
MRCDYHKENRAVFHKPDDRRRFKAMDEAYDAVERWAAAFNKGDADAVAALYALMRPSGEHWRSTSSPGRRMSGPIFVDAARAGLRVKLGPYVLSPLSETCAIAAGHYELSR